MILTTFLWVFGVICVIFGGLWLYFNIKTRRRTEKDLQFVRQPGILGRPPTTEGKKRVFLLESDLVESKIRRVHATCILILGVIVLLKLLLDL